RPACLSGSGSKEAPGGAVTLSPASEKTGRRDDRGLKRRHDDGKPASLAAGRFCRSAGHSVPRVGTGASACGSAGKPPARMTKRRVLDTDLQPARSRQQTRLR
ncbi:MAG: hypothetical protein OXI52_04625, partial [Caldilineaceae bacterium]|nr:hypothetical protein [Caldilineaceae bacterium]